MTTPRTIDNFGGLKVDALPVEDPTSELSADEWLAAAECTAQMTRTTVKAIVRFTTTTTGAGPVTPTTGRSHMGTGSASLPAITKTSAGRYDITYPTTFTDGLGKPEGIAFLFSAGRVSNLTVPGRVQTTITGPVVHVAVFDGSNAPSDLGGVDIEVEAS